MGACADYDLATRQRPPLYILCKHPTKAAALESSVGLIGALALSDDVKVRASQENVTPTRSALQVSALCCNNCIILHASPVGGMLQW